MSNELAAELDRIISDALIECTSEPPPNNPGQTIGELIAESLCDAGRHADVLVETWGAEL